MKMSAGPVIFPVKRAVASDAGAIDTESPAFCPNETVQANVADFPDEITIAPPSASVNGPPVMFAFPITDTLPYDSPSGDTT